MTAHELAALLLQGPDLPVYYELHEWDGRYLLDLSNPHRGRDGRKWVVLT